MSDTKKIEQFYTRLKEQLTLDTKWPALYLFKFIVPASNENIAEIEVLFDGLGAEIATRDSSKGTYTSVSIEVEMKSPDAVVEKYVEVSKIEGVISL